jgi:putative copper resistance protein D
VVTAGTARREWLLGAVPAVLLGLLLAWVLARPAGPETESIAGAVALIAGMTVLGLSTLRFLGGDTLTPSVLRLVSALAAVWAVSLLISAWLGAAKRIGLSPQEVGINDFFRVSGTTAALIAAVCALIVALLCAVWIRYPSFIAGEAVAALAALGLVIGPVTGHLGQQTGGAVLIAVHVLAASWWCGSLAALALTVRGRKGWATSLPMFSRYAQWLVLALIVSGVIAAVLELDSISDVWSTGYGRILIAKSVGMVLLLAVAVDQRRRWVPVAEGHRMAEDASLRRAVFEVVLMAVVIGLAAGLGTTAPS